MLSSQTPKSPKYFHATQSFFNTGPTERTPPISMEEEFIQDWLIDNDMTPKEKEILNEINQDEKLCILNGEARDYAFLDKGFIEDLDDFEYSCNAKEALHELIARSPQGEGGYYMFPYSHYGLYTEATYGPLVWNRRAEKSSGALQEAPVLDKNNRVTVMAVITNIGERYSNAKATTAPYGSIYINHKFRKLVPSIGQKVKMVIGLNGLEDIHGNMRTHAFMCVHIFKE